MNIEKSCGAIVFTKIDDEIKYVLVCNLNGVYSFPKGHMENNETEKQTALREIFEEVGLKVNIVDGFKEKVEYLLPNKENTLKEVVYFLAEYKQQKISYQKEELSNAILVNYDKAIGLFQFENNKQLLKKANDFLFENN